MSEEITLLQEGDAHITSVRAILGGTTYPIASITAVSAIKKPKGSAWLLLLLAGLPLAFIGGPLTLYAIIEYDGSIIELAGLFIAGLMALVGGALLVFGVASYRNGRELHVARISTAAREIDAVSSPDAESIGRIVEAINQAIVNRG